MSKHPQQESYSRGYRAGVLDRKWRTRSAFIWGLAFDPNASPEYRAHGFGYRDGWSTQDQEPNGTRFRTLGFEVPA